MIAFYQSPLGWLRIESGDGAVVSVLFTNDADADAVSTDPVTDKCMEQLDAYFNGTLRKFNLPLNPEGTAFQQKVWNALQDVEFGETMSYHKLSAITGNTKAIRAVGLANGKNPVAIIIPCHRIVGSDGSLTGYAGGLWRKQWLLEHEMKISAGQLTLF